MRRAALRPGTSEQDSPQYELMTRGRLLPGNFAYPPPPPHEPWRPELPRPLRSAYAEARGAEPDFTNYALTAHMRDGPFIGTLDYIWLAGDALAAERADALPHRSVVAGPYPTADEPSDHVLLAADLRLQ